MKRILLLLCALSFSCMCLAQGNFHDFQVTDIDGNRFDLATLKGKKVLVVNVASKCGLTPQYEQLQALYEKYKDRDFVVVGFPSNNFREQEPGSDQDIKAFCTSKYNVTFPMMAKIDVTGAAKAPVYKWLTEKAANGKADAGVQWNFQKFMVDERGDWVGFVAPRESPLCDRIVDWIESGRMP